ncbi:unnamed protein product [Camellia sinensis]|uniref:uncharacterized protein LOC114275336 n=1 Tax=Camellia sinensis TaxID=4442 RepID=UPI001036819F|nr:uncharacterized protein LOC114275336 [Camellia sinensis]
MGKQFIAVFVMCMVVVAAMQVREADAAMGDVYKECYAQCTKDCNAENGYTFCEMKCDAQCGTKEVTEAASQMGKFVKDVAGQND